ncbi:uncharacterized protein PITG_04352 [Phytophthora infestans T30-4]|uniref:Uncharacterized protein n=1 Tax=Phytophthora infestans (strain T30-4) TaxID=403677 RepID=D0N129_PHYIT|nr:uncharacterized protein PITG_04352 [Phytophthora infestans T30-4]EEY67342.1 conserved hypothetical protein [Phytophthora infestans T30-4]|eukprot:XP_002905990.1 conserved hypothetical protein [Phytophthora infestans T30-4]
MSVRRKRIWRCSTSCASRCSCCHKFKTTRWKRTVSEGGLPKVKSLVQDANSESDAASPVDDKKTDMKVEEEKALTTPVVKGLMLRHNAFSARTGGLHVIVVAIHGKVSTNHSSRSAKTRRCTNITFGLPFDTNKYDEALPQPAHACGHRCAVYQDVAFYLLEAILSAVDSHVGTNIFKACFKRSLKDKLVLPVAQLLSFVSHCDQIAVIADGRIAKQRSLKKLMMVSNSGNEEDKEDMTSAECLENTNSNDLNAEEAYCPFAGLTQHNKSQGFPIHRINALVRALDNNAKHATLAGKKVAHSAAASTHQWCLSDTLPSFWAMGIWPSKK